ncbi:MAG: hypothetical protein IJC99_04315 [Clostridia bacterium]|nr:hypothetical protein [Clostridia bacterium]
MADKKYDWSETDRVMEELRRQLATERELIAGTTVPGMAEVLAEAAAEAEEIAFDSAAPDEPDEVLSMHEPVEDTPAEYTPVEETDAVSAVPDAAETPDALIVDEPVTEAPASDTSEASEPALSADEPTVQEAPDEPTTAEMPVEPPHTAETAPVAETPTDAPQKPKKRRRKRIPRLSDIPDERGEAPLFEEERESVKRRAAELAEAEDADLFWRRTPKGRVPRRKTAEVASAPTEEAPATVTETAADPAPATAEEPVHTVPEITQLEIALDLPVEAETAPEPQPRAHRTRTAAPISEVEQLTVEGLLSDIFGSAAVWSEPESTEEGAPTEGEGTAAEPAPSVTQVTRLRAPDAPIIEIDGKAVELPDEETLAAEEAERLAAREAERAASEARAPIPTEGGDLPEEERVKLFSAFSVRRNKEGALPKPSIARMSAEQVAFKRKLESSEADFKLLVDLDYEDELGEAIGFEKIREYHERVVNGKTKEQVARARERSEVEYTSHSLDVKISNAYARKRRRHIVNLAVSLVMMILLFVYERAANVRELFGTAPEGFLYAPPYVALGLALFLVSVVLLRKPLTDGIKQLFQLTPSDYSLSTVVIAVTLLYHIILFFAPADSSMKLFFSPAVGNLVLIALSELFNWHRQSNAFRVVSSKYPKYALMTRTSVGNREGDAKRRLFESEQRERVFYVRPVGFVRNYYANTRAKADHHRSFGAEMLVVSALSFVLALVSVVLGKDIGYAVHTAFVTFLVTAPALTVLATSLPMVFATWLRLGRTGAIIGERAVYDCGGKTALVLPDDECFRPMPHEQFELVKNCDAERATILIRALLERIGSQLAYTVEVPEALRLPADSVTLTDVDAHGVAAVVSGERKTPILLGDVAYLQRYGIRVAPKKDGRYEELCRNMLCVAIGNRLTALFIARYRPEDEMHDLLEKTDAEGVRLVIRTKDPGIHDTLLEGLFDGADLPVHVTKPLPAESDIRADYVDANVVAIGSSIEAARTFTVCRRIRRAVRLGKAWQLLALFGGAVLAGIFTFLGRFADLPAYLVVAYHTLWCAVHALSSFAFLKGDKETK